MVVSAGWDSDDKSVIFNLITHPNVQPRSTTNMIRFGLHSISVKIETHVICIILQDTLRYFIIILLTGQ